MPPQEHAQLGMGELPSFRRHKRHAHGRLPVSGIEVWGSLPLRRRIRSSPVGGSEQPGSA